MARGDGAPSGAPGSANGGDDRKRKILIGVGAGAAVLVAIVVAVLVLGGGDSGKSGPEFEESTAVDVKVGNQKVYGINPLQPIEFPADVRDQIVAAVGAYVDNAIVNPLRTAKVDEAALASTFDAAAAARLAGPERTILVDEGLPKAVGAIKVTTPPVVLNALADREAKLAIVTANFDLTASARAEAGTVKTRRTGSFIFSPDQAGLWKISGWTISVTRTGPGVTPDTTAATPTSAPTP